MALYALLSTGTCSLIAAHCSLPLRVHQHRHSRQVRTPHLGFQHEGLADWASEIIPPTLIGVALPSTLGKKAPRLHRTRVDMLHMESLQDSVATSSWPRASRCSVANTTRSPRREVSFVSEASSPRTPNGVSARGCGHLYHLLAIQVCWIGADL